MSSQPRSAPLEEKASTWSAFSLCMGHFPTVVHNGPAAMVSEEGLRALFLGRWEPGSCHVATTYLIPMDASLALLCHSKQAQTQRLLMFISGPHGRAWEKGHSICWKLCKAAKALRCLTGSWAGGRVLSVTSLLSDSCCSSLNVQLCPCTSTPAQHHTHTHTGIY